MQYCFQYCAHNSCFRSSYGFPLAGLSGLTVVSRVADCLIHVRRRWNSWLLWAARHARAPLKLAEAGYKHRVRQRSQLDGVTREVTSKGRSGGLMRVRQLIQASNSSMMSYNPCFGLEGLPSFAIQQGAHWGARADLVSLQLGVFASSRV